MPANLRRHLARFAVWPARRGIHYVVRCASPVGAQNLKAARFPAEMYLPPEADAVTLIRHIASSGRLTGHQVKNLSRALYPVVKRRGITKWRRRPVRL